MLLSHELLDRLAAAPRKKIHFLRSEKDYLDMSGPRLVICEVNFKIIVVLLRVVDIPDRRDVRVGMRFVVEAPQTMNHHVILAKEDFIRCREITQQCAEGNGNDCDGAEHAGHVEPGIDVGVTSEFASSFGKHRAVKQAHQNSGNDASQQRGREIPELRTRTQHEDCGGIASYLLCAVPNKRSMDCVNGCYSQQNEFEGIDSFPLQISAFEFFQ